VIERIDLGGDVLAPKYDVGRIPIMPGKRKVSLSLDSDLVDELENDTEALSAQVNVMLRAEVEKRRRHRALVALLDRLDEEDGPLGPEDEADIERIVIALGGVPE
jgi:antitoxin CcdA